MKWGIGKLLAGIFSRLQKRCSVFCEVWNIFRWSRYRVFKVTLFFLDQPIQGWLQRCADLRTTLKDDICVLLMGWVRRWRQVLEIYFSFLHFALPPCRPWKWSLSSLTHISLAMNHNGIDQSNIPRSLL